MLNLELWYVHVSVWTQAHTHQGTTKCWPCLPLWDRVSCLPFYNMPGQLARELLGIHLYSPPSHCRSAGITDIWICVGSGDLIQVHTGWHLPILVLFVWDKVLHCSSAWFGINYVAQTGFVLTVTLLPQPHQCYSYRHMPPHLGQKKYFWEILNKILWGMDSRVKWRKGPGNTLHWGQYG